MKQLLRIWNQKDTGMEKTAQPAIVMVTFGAAGDLTWRKIVPALYDLSQKGEFASSFLFLAVDRADTDSEQLRKRLRKGAEEFSNHKVTDEGWEAMAECIVYLKGDFSQAKTYKAIQHHLNEHQKQTHEPLQRVFYMATPPALFPMIGEQLHEHHLLEDREQTRLVVEKPIGHDLASAQKLNAQLGQYCSERQIFRIDHFLAKETVQNILVMRFANPLFEPIWNRTYVDFVTITVAEQLGVGHRADYFEHAGTLRDMMQNHLFQLLCLIAMEPMASFESSEIRNRKFDVLKSIRPIRRSDVHRTAVRGQYAPGTIGGKRVRGYRDEDAVAENSQTETFAALKLYVDNWRWQGVPFYLRTGKRMAQSATEIVIHFRSTPHRVFPSDAAANWQPAQLILGIQPFEGIVLKLQAKQPGHQLFLKPVKMQFSYQDAFSVPSPDAYETVLWDLFHGDQTLFMRADQVEEAWAILAPVLAVWSDLVPADFPNYDAGSWGPQAANELLAQDGHFWPDPTPL